MTPEPRLTTKMWVGALLRRVDAAGGFATVLAKGDAIAGTVILVLRGKNGTITALSKINTGDGTMGWQKLFEDKEENSDDVRSQLDKRRRFDPDLWLIELDIVDPARFIDGEVLDR